MRALIVFVLSVYSCFPQTASTQILGLVTDSSGAVVPGAAIKARRVETGDVRTARSNETGNYIFPLVDSGEYEVSCVAAGFKTEIRRNVALDLNQKARIDLRASRQSAKRPGACSGALSIVR